MTTPEERTDVEEMLRTMEARIRSCETVSQRSLTLLANARQRLHQFRAEPIGGRLVGLKRLVFWFTASGFDRQSKVQESMIDAMDELARELVDLRNRMAILRLELGRNGAGEERLAAERNGRE